MVNKYTVLRPGFPGSVSHVKGVDRQGEMAWPQAQETQTPHSLVPHHHNPKEETCPRQVYTLLDLKPFLQSQENK